jgi:hypothetical protein
MRLLPASALLLVAASLTAEHTGSAAARLGDLQTKLRQSHQANDWQSNLASAVELKQLLNDNPDSLLEVARAELRLGDFGAAFRELEQFVRMGQSTDLPTRSADFTPLLGRGEFAAIQDGMKANRTPVSLASTAFLLPDPSLLAEDVDFDPGSHRFFITSVREKKIIAVRSDRSIVDFARAPDGWPLMAIKVDSKHRLLWATEVAVQGLYFSPEQDWGRSALLCYDINTGRLLRRIEGPHGSSLGDMALTTNGDVVASDGDGGGVYLLTEADKALKRLDGGDFISPQTPTMHPDGKHIFVPDYERGIALLEISTGRVQWLESAGRFALNGVDGLYFHRGQLIAVQNGTSPERVVVFTLDATLTRIESERIIERSTATLGDPTHGVVIGGDFYYIANSGWDVIDDHGDAKPGTKPSAPRVMRVNSSELGITN